MGGEPVRVGSREWDGFGMEADAWLWPLAPGRTGHGGHGGDEDEDDEDDGGRPRSWKRPRAAAFLPAPGVYGGPHARMKPVDADGAHVRINQ